MAVGTPRCLHRRQPPATLTRPSSTGTGGVSWEPHAHGPVGRAVKSVQKRAKMGFFHPSLRPPPTADDGWAALRGKKTTNHRFGSPRGCRGGWGSPSPPWPGQGWGLQVLTSPMAFPSVGGSVKGTGTFLPLGPHRQPQIWAQMGPASIGGCRGGWGRGSRGQRGGGRGDPGVRGLEAAGAAGWVAGDRGAPWGPRRGPCWRRGARGPAC